MDPTMPLGDRSNNPTDPTGEDSKATISDLFKNQIKVVSALQRKLTQDEGQLSTRDYRDIVAAVTGALSLAHRSDELQKTIETYRLFASTVMEFLKTRPEIGEELVEELKAVSRTIKADRAVDDVLYRL